MEKIEEVVAEVANQETAPSMLNFANVLTNVVYTIEQEIDDAVEEKRAPFGCTDIKMSSTGNSVIFDKIKFAENEEAGVDCSNTIYVARIEVDTKEGKKVYHQICVDMFVNNSLVCQYRHATDKNMFDRSVEAHQASVVVTKKSNKRKK